MNTRSSSLVSESNRTANLRNSNMLSWAVLLSIMLFIMRIYALSINPNVSVLSVWGILIGIISFISPMSGVAFTLGNVFISLDDNLIFGLSVGQIAGACAVLRMFLQLSTRQIKLHHIWRASLTAIVGIVFTILFSAALNNSSLPVEVLRKMLFIFLLYLLTLVYFDTFDKLVFLQYSFVIIAGLAAAWTIQQTMSNFSEYTFWATSFNNQPDGLTGNPNYQAIYLAAAMPFAIGLAMHLKYNLWRFLAIGTGILIAFGVIATASRGGLLVLGISFLLSALVWGPRQKGVQGLIGALLIITFLGFSYSEYTQTRVTNLVTNISKGTIQVETRVQLFNDSFNLWTRNPLVGVGSGNWLSSVQQLADRQSGAGSAHLWPMQILAELGIIGILWYVVFVVFCVSDYRCAIQNLDQRKSLYSNLIKGFLVASLVLSLAWTSGNPYNQLWFEFLLVGGISLGVISRQDERPINSNTTT